jgi:hypothetical protein
VPLHRWLLFTLALSDLLSCGENLTADACAMISTWTSVFPCMLNRLAYGSYTAASCICRALTGVSELLASAELRRADDLPGAPPAAIIEAGAPYTRNESRAQHDT